MTPEHKGQNLILAAILMLTLVLSYCAVPANLADTPPKHKPHSRWILRPYLVNLIIRDPEPVDQESSRQATKEVEAAAKEPEPAPEPIAETISRPEPVPAPDSKAKQKAEPETAPASQGVILMNNPGYASHTKPIVRFTHQKHMDEYSKSCGDCHHDDAGKPLDLKPGDPIAGCIECHKETKKKKGEKLDKSEKIKTYHDEALHANCIECHKAFNTEKGDPKGLTPAPVSCKACHQ